MQPYCLNTERRVKRHEPLIRTLITIVLLTVFLHHASAQDLYVGSNNSGQTTNFSSGTNSYINTYVGYASNSSNNSLTIGNTNTLLTNSGDVYLGDSGPNNSMVISNGGTVSDSNGWIGYSNSSTGNSALVSDSNSLWSNAADMTVGGDGTRNSLVVSNGGQVAVTGGSNGTVIGLSADSSNNSVLITGAGSAMTNESDLIVGFRGGVNLLVISNGGTVAVDGNNYGTVIGLSNTANNNSILVTGTNSNGNASTLTNTHDLYVGYTGSSNNLRIEGGGLAANFNGFIGYSNTAAGSSVMVSDPGSLWSIAGDMSVGVDGSRNSLVISNGGQVAVNGVYLGAVIGLNADSSNNSVLVTGFNTTASTLTLTNADLIIGYAGSSNSLTINGGAQVANFNGWIGYSNTAVGNADLVSDSGSIWTNNGDLYIGADGSGNRLVIQNGAQVSVSVDSSSNGAVIGYGSNSSSNSVQVNDASLFVGADTNGGYANADLYVGYNGSSNSLVIINGGQVYVSGANIGAVIGYGSNSSGNLMLVSGSDGNGSYSSLNVGADKNNVFYNVDLIVGYNGGSNSLVISNGGQAYVSGVRYGMVIGFNDGSSNNSVLVTGSSSTLTNGLDLYVGYGGSGTLTVANGGTVYVDNSITIASSNGAVGTLNIGSLGGNDTAGTIVTPSVAFGSGNGTINFNQTSTAMLTSTISGLGSLKQLGVGTTILSGNNSYTGTTTISAGTLVAAVTNALGDSDLILGGGASTATLSLSTNLTLSSLSDFDWGSNGVIALAQGTHTLTLGGMTNSAGTNDGVNVFQFLNSTLSNDTNVLVNYGSLADFTSNSFSVQGISGYSFSTNNNQVTAYLSTNANVVVCNNITISNTLTVGSFTVECGSTTTVASTGTINASVDVLVTDNSTLDDNGLIVTPNLTVDQGSTLMGVGTVQLTGGTLSINGTFAPGNSPGTFFVTGGNLVMGASSVWDEQVYSVSVYDRVVVAGSAMLNGTMNITGYGSGGLEYGEKLNFLSASGGISGAFSSITAPAGFRGRLLLSGNNTEANILIAPASYTQLAANRNQSNVAKALDSFIPSTSGDQLTVSTSLDSLSASEYNQAFNAIMPTFYQQIATIAFNEANALNMELNQRLWGLRLAEGGGFSMSGLADNFPILEGQGDGKGVLDSKKDILRPGTDNHWSMFVDGNGIFAQANSANMLPGYNSESGGVTTGVTYRVNPKLSVGAYTGYQGTYTKSGSNGSGLGTGSSLTDNAVRFGIFGTYGQSDGKGAFINALLGGAYHNFQATRVIQYTGMNRTANSSPGAGELDAMLATGYDIQVGKFTFGPTTSLQYTYLGVNGLNETGAQSIDFNSGGWNSSSMLSSVGAHAAYTWQARPDVLVIPQVSLSWQHEFMQNPYAISGNLGGTSPNFSNWSSAPIRDFLYTGIGFTVEFAKRWNTSLFYNAAAGNSDLVSQNIFLSAGLKF